MKSRLQGGEMLNAKVLTVLITTALTVSSLAGQTIIWDKTWDSGRNDFCGGIALDTANDAVYIAGASRDGGNMETDDIVTLKYSTDGNFEWAKVFDSDTNDMAYDVCVDDSGYIYVAGYSFSSTGQHIRLIKYDSDSAEIWNMLSNGYDGELAYGVTADAQGSIYVTGPLFGQFQTVKFKSDGNEEWADVAEGLYGYSFDLAAAPNGSIYVAGIAANATNDPCVVRYEPSGDTMWHMVYDLGAEEYIEGIAIDQESNLYLAGTTRVSQDSPGDILLIKVDADGHLVWNKIIDCGQDEEGKCIAVDGDYICVAGKSYNTSNYTSSLPLICYDKQGNLLWDTLLVSTAQAKGIVSDGKHNLYISAQVSAGDFRVIKVHHVAAIEEQPSSPSSPSSPPSSKPSLEVLGNFSSSSSLRYSIPVGQSATLSFYSADGRLIETHPLPPSQTTFTWNARRIPSGVYFARLVSGDASASGKVLIVR